MKKLLISTLSILALVGFTSVANAQTTDPIITSVTPNVVKNYSAATVTVYGSNLSNSPSLVVYDATYGFGLGAFTNPVTVTDSYVVFNIDKHFIESVLRPKTYKIGIETNGNCKGGCSSNRLDFTIQDVPPVLTSISPNPASPGATVTVFGSNLSQTTDVRFSDVLTSSNTNSFFNSNITNTSPTSVTFLLDKSMPTGDYDLKAIAGGAYTRSNGLKFTVAATPNTSTQNNNTSTTNTSTNSPSYDSSGTYCTYGSFSAGGRNYCNMYSGTTYPLNSSSRGNTAPQSNTSSSSSSPTLPTDIDSSGTSSTCLILSQNIRYRSRDTGDNDDVASLQDFLNSKGYFTIQPTGFAGSLTIKAIKQFQQANGISPTGFVGTVTRAKIKELTCN